MIGQLNFGLRERLAMWIAFRLPRRVVYWAACRLIAHAGYSHPQTEMGRITPAECLQSWNQQ